MKKPTSFIIILIFVSVIVGLGSFGTFIALSRQPEKQVTKVKKEIPKESKPVEQVYYSDFSDSVLFQNKVQI